MPTFLGSKEIGMRPSECQANENKMGGTFKLTLSFISYAMKVGRNFLSPFWD